MAKKINSDARKQHLSPENYIKTKGRTLPLYECLVNTNWEEQKMANIIISRKHSNGNVTLCVYLIDLFCVGVKDTFFRFNIEMEEYNEIIKRMTGDLESHAIDYVLAHNIIFGSIDFADTYDILPHKDFTKTTQYFLEEDTDDIEYMDVDFGKKGLPFFIANNFYTPFQARAIIQKIEKVIGKGNANFVFGDFKKLEDYDDDDLEFEDDFEEDKEIDDERYQYFDSLQPSERAELFKTMVLKDNDITNQKNNDDLLKLANTICYRDLSVLSNVENLVSKWEKEFKLPIGEVYITELFSMKSEIEFDEKMFDFIRIVSEELSSFSENVDQKVKKSLKKYLYNPYFCYLNLKLIEKEGDHKIYAKQVKENYLRFPDYPLFKIEYFKQLIYQMEKVSAKDILTQNIFKGRKGVTPFEMLEYLQLKVFKECNPDSFTKIQALENWALDLELGEDLESQFLFITQMLKVKYLELLYKIKH
jgi:hypothetical protein